MVPSSGQLTVKTGGAVSMECKASGNPVPSVTWSKKVRTWGAEWRLEVEERRREEILRSVLLLGREHSTNREQVLMKFHFPVSLIALAQNLYKKLSDGSVLTLDRIKINDAGIYQCTAENGVGKPVSLDMKLDVLCK